MDDLNTSLRDLPVELKALVLSHIEHVKTRQILALSSTFQEAFPLPGALPRTFDFEGVAGDDMIDHLVRVLGDDRVRRSLDKERALELLIGVYKDRLCEYACGRNFEVLKWAHNELDLPWAPYRAGRVSDDVLVLRVLRETWPVLKQCWRAEVEAEEWDGVKMVDGRVVELELDWFDVTGAVPAEIGQLTSLKRMWLWGSQLTSLPAKIGQLTSLEKLTLGFNKLTSVPAEIGQLTSLEWLNLRENQLTRVPDSIRELRAARCDVFLDDGVTVDEL